MKRFARKVQFALLIILMFAYNAPSQAQFVNTVTSQIARRKRKPFQQPKPPVGIGSPGRRTHTGVRTICSKPSDTLLTALVPLYASKYVWSVTTSERPTFWFNVPYSSTDMHGSFVLRDEAKQQTRYTIPLKSTPGIIGFALPATAPSLQVGKSYHWYFEIYCGANSNKKEELIAYVEGNIQRQSLDSLLERQLQKAPPDERIDAYSERGIWQEALTTAAELKRTHPTDTGWETLLQSVELEEIAQQPLVNCCQP